MKNRKVVLLVVCFVMFFVSLAEATYFSVVAADNATFYCSFDTYNTPNSGYDVAIPGGVVNGANGLTAGILGNALNGNIGPGTTTVTQPGVFSVEVWAKSDTAVYNNGGFILRGSVYQSPLGVIMIGRGENKVEFHIGWGAWYQDTITVADPAKWNQFVMTFDNGAAAGGGATATGKIYINGDLVSTKTGGTVQLPTTYQSTFTVGDSFNGKVDEFSVYNGVLSQGQIQAHYNAIPEPATMILLLGGVMGLIRRK